MKNELTSLREEIYELKEQINKSAVGQTATMSYAEIVSQTESIKKEIRTLNDKLYHQETKPNQAAIEPTIAELQEREKRSTNVLIFGLSVSSATNSTFFNQSGILPLNETVITNYTSTVVSNNTTTNNNSTLLSNSTIEVATNISNVTYTNVTSDLNITTPISSITNITTSKPDISTNTFNSHVSLHLSYNSEFLCGGVILDSRFIVTVANCMYYNWGGILPPIIVTVSAGRKKLSVEPFSQYQVEEISFHNAYKETTLEYDIALIKIKASIAFSDRIDRISLPKTQIKYKQCTVTGWNKISSELDALPVDLVSCSQAQISEEVICAQTTVSNFSLCNLSKGSSLICGDGLFGILSNEPSCASNNQVGVFQNLEKSMKWLKQNGVNGVSNSSGTIVHFPKWITMILVVSILSC